MISFTDDTSTTVRLLRQKHCTGDEAGRLKMEEEESEAVIHFALASNEARCRQCLEATSRRQVYIVYTVHKEATRRASRAAAATRCHRSRISSVS